VYVHKLKSLKLPFHRPCRPIEVWAGKAPTFSRQSAHRCRWGKDISLFSTAFKSSLDCNQSSIWYVFPSPGTKQPDLETDQPLPHIAEVIISWNYTTISPYVFMAVVFSRNESLQPSLIVLPLRDYQPRVERHFPLQFSYLLVCAPLPPVD
jgi:hypothetical protein